MCDLSRGCKATILAELREWIIHEEIRRFGRHPDKFEIEQGYMLALSNLLEFIQEIDGKITC